MIAIKGGEGGGGGGGTGRVPTNDRSLFLIHPRAVEVGAADPSIMRPIDVAGVDCDLVQVRLRGKADESGFRAGAVEVGATDRVVKSTGVGQVFAVDPVDEVGLDRDVLGFDAIDEGWVDAGAVEVGAGDLAGALAFPGGEGPPTRQ